MKLVSWPAACTWAVWGFRSRKSVEVGFLDILPRVPRLEKCPMRHLSSPWRSPVTPWYFHWVIRWPKSPVPAPIAFMFKAKTCEFCVNGKCSWGLTRLYSLVKLPSWIETRLARLRSKLAYIVWKSTRGDKQKGLEQAILNYACPKRVLVKETDIT